MCEMCCSYITQFTKINTVIPSAAWYLYLNFNNYSDKLLKNGINSSDELCIELINKKGVITVAGCYFSDNDYSLRYSFVDLPKIDGINDYSMCINGLIQINDFLKELK